MTPDELLQDVLAEPESLRALAGSFECDPLDDLGNPPRHVLLIGMGSSFFAATDCAVALRAAGVDAHAERASTGLPAPSGPDTLCVLISASGTTAETIAAFERHRGASRTLAVTAALDGPLLGAEHVLRLEGAAPLTDTAVQLFQATVAALKLLSSRLTGGSSAAVVELIERAADSQAALIDERDAWLPAFADAVGVRPVFVAAPDERMASANQAALTLREGPRIVADACEIGDWSHVDVYLSLRPGYTLVLMGGSIWSDEMLRWMSSRNRDVLTVGRPLPRDAAALHVPFPNAADDGVAALVEATAVELLACELWSRAAGDDPTQHELRN
jgi:glutamine---fructose-6-phosphate transaminase (isomerizing)